MMQALFLPVMAVAFAVAPVAGQNYGARHYERVRETFRAAALLSSALMLAHHAACASGAPEWFIESFTRQPDVLAVGAPYLRIISWNFVATGLIFTCSGMFQALGNTVAVAPELGFAPVDLRAAGAVALSHRPHFTLTEVWYLSVATRDAAGAHKPRTAAAGVAAQAGARRRRRQRPAVATAARPRRRGRERLPTPTSARCPAADRTSGKDCAARPCGGAAAAAGAAPGGCRWRAARRGRRALHAGARGHRRHEALRGLVVAVHAAGEDVAGRARPASCRRPRPPRRRC